MIESTAETYYMNPPRLSRRNYLGLMGAAAAAPAAALPGDSDRERRMKWWHEARFGMFIHWGIYSVRGRAEWAMESEGIPTREYEQLARQFRPKPHAARAWAKLARQAGMKYMVMTSKHHDGFCLFNTSTTDYCAPKQAAGRDLVSEFLEAAHAEGLRAGLYYSLMDWHHPDGAICRNNEDARKRFVQYIHTHVREICSNYGKLDILWYDFDWPLDAKGWDSVGLNEMMFKLQPDIIVNNRNGLPGDFTTPEQHITAFKRPWEACMTLNDSWGFQSADDNWKTPKSVLRNLIKCSRDGGNYLLNIGPTGDGSIPEPSIAILTETGRWLARNGESIYKAARCEFMGSAYSYCTRKDNTLYVHIYFWPGETASITGLKTKVKSARLLVSGKPVEFRQDLLRVHLLNLPKEALDTPITTLALECDGVPEQYPEPVRVLRKRYGVNIS